MWSCAVGAATKVTLDKGVSFGGADLSRACGPFQTGTAATSYTPLNISHSEYRRWDAFSQGTGCWRPSSTRVRPSLVTLVTLVTLGGAQDGGLDAADRLDGSPAVLNDPVGGGEVLLWQRLERQQLGLREDRR
jgi:hypothetical protein